MQTWKETIGLYRLLDEEDVTFEALMQPHWDQTREQIGSHSLVLLVQEYHRDRPVALSPDARSGPDRQRARTRTVSANGAGGAARTRRGARMCHAGPLCPHPSPAGETRHQRSDRETDVWMRLVERLGRVAASTTVVHVGDREADMFPSVCKLCIKDRLESGGLLRRFVEGW